MNITRTDPIAYSVISPAIRHYGNRLNENPNGGIQIQTEPQRQIEPETNDGSLGEITAPPLLTVNDSLNSTQTTSLKSDGGSSNYGVAFAAAIYALNKSFEEQAQILNLLA